MRRPLLIPLVLGALALVAGCGGSDPAPTTTGGTPTTDAAVVLDRPVAARGPAPIAGIEDDRLAFPNTVAPEDPTARIALAASLGGRQVRVALPWSAIAPTPPTKPTDPSDPAYDWRRTDAIVRAARRRGVEVLFTVYQTPAWAADGSVPVVAPWPAEARRPRDAADLGAFATAAARRYAPKGVLRWEGWNEPNTPLFLQPQWEQRDGVWTNVSAATYSAMQRAFYDGVKSVAPNAEVAGGSLAPAGSVEPTSATDRTQPTTFLELLDGEGLRPPMDAVSHHPYPLTAPRDVSNPDASYVDLYNLDRLQQTIDGTYLAGKPLWLTEFGFSTRPVANLKRSVTEAQQALFLADAYRRVRSNPRVKVFTWYFLQDHPNWASGLLRADGSRKPAAAANAFPFAADVPWVAGEPADVARGTSVSMVGQIRLANRASRVTIESRDGSRWRRLAAVTTRADGSFAVRVKAMRTRALRARWSPGASAAGARPVVSTVATVRVRP